MLSWNILSENSGLKPFRNKCCLYKKRLRIDTTNWTMFHFTAFFQSWYFMQWNSFKARWASRNDIFQMWWKHVTSIRPLGLACGLCMLVVVNRPAVNYTDVLLNRLSAPVKWKPEILKGHDNISVWMIHRVNCFKPFPGQNPSYLTYFIHYSHSFEWCNKTEIAFCEWHMDSL